MSQEIKQSPTPIDWGNIPPPRNWAEVRAAVENGKIKKPDELIKGMLYRGGKMLISAPSKGRKTWLLLDLAISVARGKTWLGFDTDRAPVLYLDMELLPHETPERMESILKAKGLSNIDDFHLINLRGVKAEIKSIGKNLISFIKENDIGLLVIDPWYKLSGGADEIGTEGVAGLLADLEAIAREGNCAIVIAHHFTKGDSSQKSVIDLASGSGVFGRDPDVICGIRELEESTDDNPLVRMEIVVRSFKPIRPIGLRWDHPVWKRDDSLNLDLKAPGKKPGRPTENSVSDIMEVLGNHELSVQDWAEQCLGKIGISHRTFKGLKASAKVRGLIDERKEGRSVFCKAKRAEMFPPIPAPINQPKLGL